VGSEMRMGFRAVDVRDNLHEEQACPSKRLAAPGQSNHRAVRAGRMFFT
jgi:hypothetical protein